jgi:hypothetical protein
MKLCPGEDEAELSSAQAAVDDLEVVDSDLGFAFGVTCMEMREAMIVENIAIVIPKKRLMVGTPGIMPRSAVARRCVLRLTFR